MLLTTLLLLLGAALAAQPSLFDALHANQDTAVFTLTTEWKPLMRRKKDKVYQPVALSINGNTLPGKIRTRGHMRLEVCYYPSLKVKLDENILTDLGYSPLNELKIVIQCNSKSLGESYLRREKLMYDLHAIVSDFYHRTVPISLVTPESDTIQGFLVESEQQLEARYGARIVDHDNVSTRSLDREAYLNMCLFNYFILNTDWSVYNRHNVECILPSGATSYVPIPYDFDYSGLVGTHYAVPHESMDLLSVHHPKFLGRGITLEEISTVADNFLAHGPELRAAVEAYPELDRRRRKYILDRLDDFLEELADEKALADLAGSR
ncbi:hypothetical protein GGR26_000952 [Lewinella marina]|uniref:Uncharacterized protein n=1 Tax=Neolewinella marina TaxID=438751 RepID=A0A2G0CIB3_9BACT|nr:hypothetical protein [Neolewinella marina]NJB85207.1 hypothetical protein [Neolewinella marina]PHK99660.1 hypothetical protein CGL56_01010 [Neolewinella marina]